MTIVKLGHTWHVAAALCTEQTVLSHCDCNSRSEVSCVVKVCGSVFGNHNEFALIGKMAPPSSSTPPRRTLGRRNRSLSVPTRQNLRETKDWVGVKGSLGAGLMLSQHSKEWVNKDCHKKKYERVLLAFFCWKCQFLKQLCNLFYASIFWGSKVIKVLKS